MLGTPIEIFCNLVKNGVEFNSKLTDGLRTGVDVLILGKISLEELRNNKGTFVLNKILDLEDLTGDIPIIDDLNTDTDPTFEGVITKEFRPDAFNVGNCKGTVINDGIIDDTLISGIFGNFEERRACIFKSKLAIGVLVTASYAIDVEGVKFNLDCFVFTGDDIW